MNKTSVSVTMPRLSRECTGLKRLADKNGGRRQSDIIGNFSRARTPSHFWTCQTSKHFPLSVCRDSSGGSSSQLANLVIRPSHIFLSAVAFVTLAPSDLFPSQLRDSYLDGRAQEAKNVMDDGVDEDHDASL